MSEKLNEKKHDKLRDRRFIHWLKSRNEFSVLMSETPHVDVENAREKVLKRISDTK